MSAAIDAAIISPCKNRLKYLKQCIASWQSQDLGPHIRLSIFVVGYGCPQRSAEWANELGCASVRGIAVERDTETFCLGRARNIGLRAAIDSGAQFLAVVDCDLELPHNFIRRYVGHMVGNGLEMCKAAWPWEGGQEGVGFGSLAVMVPEIVLRLTGYDESFRSYGHDDSELYFRADAQGIKSGWLPWEDIVHHCEDLTNSDRMEFYQDKDFWGSISRNLEIAKNTDRPVNVDGWGML